MEENRCISRRVNACQLLFDPPFFSNVANDLILLFSSSPAAAAKTRHVFSRRPFCHPLATRG
jgi:hypothetical protein